MKALKKENKVNAPITKDNAVEEVKTVKKVAPHWMQIGKYPEYLTVTQPFYNDRTKEIEVRVIQADGLEIQKHSFKTRKEAENKHSELLTKLKKGTLRD